MKTIINDYLDRYLYNSRLLRTNPNRFTIINNYSKEQIKKDFQLIKRDIVQEDIEIITCDSYNKNANIFYCFNKWYLLLDIHLIDFMYLLHKSYIERNVNGFSYLILIENALVNNSCDLNNLLNLCYKYMEFKKDFIEIGVGDQKIIRLYTSFVINHELVHFTVNNNTKDDNLYESIQNHMKHLSKLFSWGDNPEELAKIFGFGDLRNSTTKENMFEQSDYGVSRFEFVFLDFARNKLRETNYEFPSFPNQKEFIDECYCDIMAMILCVNHHEEFQVSLSQALPIYYQSVLCIALMNERPKIETLCRVSVIQTFLKYYYENQRDVILTAERDFLSMWTFYNMAMLLLVGGEQDRTNYDLINDKIEPYTEEWKILYNLIITLID